MGKARYCGGVLLAALTLAWQGSAGMAAGAPAATMPASASPRAVVDKLTRDVLEVLRDTKLERPQKREKIVQMAYATLDFQTLSRLTLGQYSRDVPAAKQTEFVEQFKKHISSTYGHTTDEYTDEDIQISGDRQETNGDWTVLTKIIGTKDGTRQEIAKVEYRLRKKEDAWKIIDVTIDGVSLMANFRSQFQSIMANGGIDKLLQLLREKNAAG